MTTICIGMTVQANRDIPKKGVTKGDRGIVHNVQNIDSEYYLDIELRNGKFVGTSSENCWDIVKTIEVRRV